MSTVNHYEEYLRVGFIQTVIDEDYAWDNPPSINMKLNAQLKAWQEIEKGFYNLNDNKNKPHIIILPELSVPKWAVYQLKSLSKDIGAVVIAGLDFCIEKDNKVSNRAIVIVPNRWPGDVLHTSTSHFYFGKTHFSNEELELFEKLNKLGKPTSMYSPSPDPVTYIIDAGKFGRLGVAICSDFFDIERFVIYKGKIHHMFVISHNKDTNSYYFLAEAISRLVYCNVVICNTGYYGDSLAFSPYRDSFKRIIYRHVGQGLFSTQIVSLPVASLDKAQRYPDDPPKDKNGKSIFKSPPPGYYESQKPIL